MKHGRIHNHRCHSHIKPLAKQRSAEHKRSVAEIKREVDLELRAERTLEQLSSSQHFRVTVEREREEDEGFAAKAKASFKRLVENEPFAKNERLVIQEA